MHDRAKMHDDVLQHVGSASKCGRRIDKIEAKDQKLLRMEKIFRFALVEETFVLTSGDRN